MGTNSIINHFKSKRYIANQIVFVDAFLFPFYVRFRLWLDCLPPRQHHHPTTHPSPVTLHSFACLPACLLSLMLHIRLFTLFIPNTLFLLLLWNFFVDLSFIQKHILTNSNERKKRTSVAYKIMKKKMKTYFILSFARNITVCANKKTRKKFVFIFKWIEMRSK